MNYVWRMKGLIRKDLLILYLIVLLGSFLRLQGVFTNSFAFTYDVGRDMLALWDIVYFHKITLIGATTGLPGIFYGPWWYFLLTPFFIIFSGNPQGIALTMGLIGTASIIPGYFLGKRLGGKFLGLAIAGLISISPNLISLAAQIWNPNIAPFFVILILLLLSRIYLSDKKEKSKYYFLLGFLLAFNADLEIVFGLLLSIGIVLSLIFTLKRKISLKNIVFLVSGGIVVLSPRIFFELRHQFLMTKSLFGFFAKGGGGNQASSLAELFTNRVSIMLDQVNSSLAGGNELIGILILLLISLTLLFVYRKVDVLTKNFINTSVIVIFVFLFGTIFFSHDIWPHYLVGLPVFYILLFSISLYLLSKKLSSNLVPGLILFFVIVLNLNPVKLIQDLSKPLWQGDAAVYRNQLAIIDYVYKESNGKAFKYVAYTPPVYDYTYRYLFMWRGQQKYHYLPSAQSSIAYFILEPDYQYPSRLLEWLRLREGDGKIIKSEKLSSGIIVQTRLVK